MRQGTPVSCFTVMRASSTLLILLSIAEAFGGSVLDEWHLFKLQYNKNYSIEIEENLRHLIFSDNWFQISAHNNLYDQGLVPFKMEMNQFGDLLVHEYVAAMNGFKSKYKSNNISSSMNEKSSYYIEPANVELAQSVDWRTKGAVTPVKDQGQCGSCWAFSATGSLEGQNFRKSGELVSLSEQNLIDCSGKYGNHGCNGGYVDRTFQYIKDNQGVDTEQSYPYEAKNDRCRYNPRNTGATDSGYVDLPRGDEKHLMSAVATVGPISVGIDATHQSFQFYSGGVYADKRCSPRYIDHAVLVVGYGTTEDGLDYWLIKNSWGEGWGEKGYMKMIRNKQNHCGIASEASYPLV